METIDNNIFIQVNQLPYDVLSSIFSLLSIGELFAIRRTCKLWQRISSQAGLICEITRWDIQKTKDNSTHTKLKFVDDSTLLLIAKFFARIEAISLVGLPAITDYGAKQLVTTFQHSLKMVCISDCANIKKPGSLFIMPPSQTKLFPQLASVSFANSQAMNAANILGLKQCWSIQSLNLSGCRKIDDDAIKHLATNNPTISTLILKGCFKITKEGFHALFKLKNLKVLNVEGCSEHMNTVTFSDMADSLAPIMQELYLKSCIHISASILEQALPTFLRLTKLNLNFCTQVTDQTLNTIALGLSSSLQALHLQGCHSLTNNGLQTMISYCNQLTLLDFRGCNLVTDDALSNIHKLYLIDLRVCSNITDIGIAAICKKSSNCSLTTLDLENCHAVTDTSIQHIASLCMKLEILNLFGCYQVTLSSLLDILHACQFLKILVLRNSSITNVQQLKQQNCNCKIVL